MILQAVSRILEELPGPAAGTLGTRIWRSQERLGAARDPSSACIRIRALFHSRKVAQVLCICSGLKGPPVRKGRFFHQPLSPLKREKGPPGECFHNQEVI